MDNVTIRLVICYAIPGRYTMTIVIEILNINGSGDHAVNVLGLRYVTSHVTVGFAI